MLKYKHFKNREEWLIGREKFPGIGASEAAVVLGASNWLTPTELWEIKTGHRKPKDLSESDIVQYGTCAEQYIRGLFMLKHEDYKLTYRPFDFLYQSERPWLRCTLDGELESPDGVKGILEIKSHFVRSKSDLQQWNGRIPDHYLIQLLHQHLATGFSYAYLTAELIYQSFDSSIKTYLFDFSEYTEEAEWILSEEEKFWELVQSGNSPSVKLIL